MGLLLTVAAFVVLGGSGVFMALVGGGYLRTYRRLQQSDPVDIRRLTEPTGPVELAGTARAHERTLRSPFTDTETLLHEWKVFEHHPDPDGSGKEWTAIAWDDDETPFLLEDETGAVLVDPNSAEQHVQATTRIEVEPDETPPPAVREFLEGTDRVEADHDYDRRYRESRLDPGHDVHIYGPVREVGHSVDLPGGVDAVVGADDPENRVLEVSEITLTSLIDQIQSDHDQFVITNTDEAGAERHMAKMGAVWLAVGVVFMTTPVALVLFG